MTLVFETGLGVLALAVGALAGDSPSQFVQWRFADVGWGLAATGPMLAALLVCIYLPVPPLQQLRKTVSVLIRSLFPDARAWQLALVSLAAGFGEELLFRGVLQHFATEWWGLAVGILAASILFGLAHALSTAYFLITAIVGGYLGWLWIHFDNLLVPIVAHAAYDFVALVVILRLPVEEDVGDE
jgi:hypothetical protein